MSSYEKRTWWSRHGMSARVQNDGFLEAAITCAFLVAAADGSQSEREYDALLDRLELLGGIDRDKIDEVLTEVSNDVESNGFEPRIARAAELVGDRDGAEAAIMLGIAIALADDEFSAPEREVAGQIAAGFGLKDLDLDEMVRVLGG
jgi:tellurite resistance protein